MSALNKPLLTTVYNQARAALATAKEELRDAEVRVMQCDTKVMTARTHLSTVVKMMHAFNENETEVAVPSSDTEQKVAFKAMTDAIQTIQMYAIRNGMSLGSTMDALTERLFRVEA
jgi:hypothetical protein